MSKDNGQQQGRPEPRAAEVAPGPAEQQVPVGAERSSQARARERELLRTRKALGITDAPAVEDFRPLTRRELRNRELAERRGLDQRGFEQHGLEQHAPDAALPEGGTGGPLLPGESPADAAAREELVTETEQHLAMLEAQAPADPEAVDLEILAQQHALAERAAVLNRRAAQRNRLEALHRGSSSGSHRAGGSEAAAEPDTGERHPEQHLPGETPEPEEHHLLPEHYGTGFLLGSDGSSGTPATASIRLHLPPAPERSEAPPAVDAGGTDAVGTDPVGTEAVGMDAVGGEPAAVPLAAVRAHGLQPLDAATAGMKRANARRTVIIAALGAGAAAVVAGLTMIFSALNQ